MIYFRILGVSLGGIMILGGLWVASDPQGWEKRIVRIYPERRPRWAGLSSLIVLALVLWTWVEFLIRSNAYTFVITLMVSLSFAKILASSLFYTKCREIIFGLFSEPLALRVVMLSWVAVGAALLILGVII